MNPPAGVLAPEPRGIVVYLLFEMDTTEIFAGNI